MKQKIYLLDSNGNKICGILSSNKRTSSIVVMCHGLNSGKDSSTNLALEKVFLKNNIDVLRFDFFGHMGSEGNVEDRNIEKFVDDILKSIEYLKKKNYKNIGLYGASFGGVASVIAVSKTSDIKVMALKAAGMGRTSRNIDNYKEDFKTKSWIKAGKKVKIPTLIIHGTKDEDVEVKFGKELAKSIKNSELKLYKGADHRFSKKEDFDKMVKDVSEFIMNVLA
ncbi:alpha/beta hydrolase [Candidatus Woesearchaeota archaeon]|nr:alpha/beta hydrolase [Candidatus Woesearchaeota archaeon]